MLFGLPIPFFILPVLIFAALVYLAISKKSSPVTRAVAIAALIVIVVFTGVCLYLIFGERGAVVVGPGIDIFPIEEDVHVVREFSLPLLILTVLFIALIVFIVYYTLRERKRLREKSDFHLPEKQSALKSASRTQATEQALHRKAKE